MDGAKAQIIFTDPPYNVPVNGHISGLGKHQHREFAMALDRCIISVWIEEGWRHLQELLAAGNKVYSEIKNLCVWVKDNGGMGSLYRSRHECVAVFKHGKAPHRNNVELGQHGRYRTNVWEYAGANSFAHQSNEEGDLLTLHPTVNNVMPMQISCNYSANQFSTLRK